ncbi:hypothetical protein FK516_31025, partial [Klebsiella pneumoniae]|nr:hypothetical protein [Klebsiella pneumoniae]
MEHRTPRRLAAGLSLGLALTATVATVVPAGAADRTSSRESASLTDFGYRGDVYGVKLVTDSV